MDSELRGRRNPWFAVVCQFVRPRGKLDSVESIEQPCLGSLAYVNAEGVSTPLAIMQRYVRNQGDGWTRTLDAFRLALEDLVTPPPGQEFCE